MVKRAFRHPNIGILGKSFPRGEGKRYDLLLGTDSKRFKTLCNLSLGRGKTRDKKSDLKKRKRKLLPAP